ncbi:MAG: class I SAM-dependent methyltransferase [Comamonadaceae bacterium]|nr:class I SAM-dependent methyltransferase [Comamonadaceae bacterium]
MGGNEVSGIEPSRQLCGHARSRGVAVTEGYFNGASVMEAKPGVYDCVVIRHVLEHIHELNDIVEAISEITAPGGILVAEVPDFRKVVEDRIFSEHLS